MFASPPVGRGGIGQHNHHDLTDAEAEALAQELAGAPFGASGSPDGLIAPGGGVGVGQPGSTNALGSEQYAYFDNLSVVGRTIEVRSMLLEIDGRAIETSELPSLRELGITSGTLEVPEEIAERSDVPGLERHTLELLVRAVVFADRLAHPPSLPRPE